MLLNDINPTEEQAIAQLQDCDQAYAEGSPVVSDAEYDSLRLKASTLWPRNAYFKETGVPVTKGKKVKLPYSLGSLNQRYPEDIEAWVAKYKLEDKTLVLTDKLDGISCLLVYKNGKLSQAFTRGDGYEGQDITHHVKHVPNVPQTISSEIDLLAVRAELIMRVAIFCMKYATEYRNPRNMVAGVFNRIESNRVELSDVDCVAYEIIDYKLWFKGGNTWPVSKLRYLVSLEDYGFKVARHGRFDASILNDDYLSKSIEHRKAKSEYELDGVVITVDDWFNVESQSTSSSINPEHSIKYKVASEEGIKTTTIVDVSWEASKGGLLKPTVQVEPVELEGTTVTYATGINAKWIVANGVGKGATCRIHKAGQVIPEIIEVLTKVAPDLPEGTEGVDWEWNDNGVEIVLKDKNNPQVIFKQVLDFFVSLEVEGFKEGSLTKLWEHFDWDGTKYTSILHIICDLTVIEWEKVIGANGKKIHGSLHKRLQSLSMDKLMGSLNYFGSGFGLRKAKLLLDQVDYSVLKTMSIEQIATLNQFDIKTATNVVNGIPLFEEYLVQFKDYIKFGQPVEPVGNALSNCIIVFTGFRDKALQASIESLGGKVGSSVSGKTTHLLASGKSIDEGSGKMDKAKQMGVKVMTPDQFKEEYGL